MTWNHRVMVHNKGSENQFYTIHEVYYGIDGPEDVSWTENPISPYGENVDELRENLELMLKALDQPVLDYSKFDDNVEMEDRWDNE